MDETLTLEQAQQEIQKAMDKKVSELKIELTEEQKTALTEAQKDITEKLSKLDETVSKADYDKLLKEVGDLTTTIEAQGKAMKLNDGGKQNNASQILKEFADNYEKLGKDRRLYAQPEEQFRIKTSSDVITVNDVPAQVYPPTGTIGTIGTLSAYFSQFIGFFRALKPISKIMDLVEILPLKEDTLYAITESEIGDAEFVPECGLKPIVKPVLTLGKAEAEVVAATFKSTEKTRTFYEWIIDRFKIRVGELIIEKIPQFVLNLIKTNATAYTPIPELAVHTNPNNYDVIGTLIAYLQILTKLPNVLIINPVAWAKMQLLKASDGHYMLQNGGSIIILQEAIIWGGNRIEVIIDATLGYDDIIIGDLYDSVKIGLHPELIYREGYVGDEFQRNILTHVTEKFVAGLIPEGAKTSILYETFSNVKTLITAP